MSSRKYGKASVRLILPEKKLLNKKNLKLQSWMRGTKQFRFLTIKFKDNLPQSKSTKVKNKKTLCCLKERSQRLHRLVKKLINLQITHISHRPQASPRNNFKIYTKICHLLICSRKSNTPSLMSSLLHLGSRLIYQN